MYFSALNLIHVEENQISSEEPLNVSEIKESLDIILLNIKE